MSALARLKSVIRTSAHRAMRRQSVAVLGAAYRRSLGDWTVATRKREWKAAMVEAGSLPDLMAELASEFPSTSFVFEDGVHEARAVSVQMLAALAGYKRQKHFNQAVQAINRQGADDHHQGAAPRFYACPQSDKELAAAFRAALDSACKGLSGHTGLGLRLFAVSPIGCLSEHHDTRLSAVVGGVEETRYGYEVASQVAATNDASGKAESHLAAYEEFLGKLGSTSTESHAAAFLKIAGASESLAVDLHRLTKRAA